MKLKSKKHFLHYLILVMVSLLAIASIIYFPNLKITKSTIVIVFSLSYFLWGIFHHTLEKDIHPEIIFEYLLFSILGAASVLAVLYYL